MYGLGGMRMGIKIEDIHPETPIEALLFSINKSIEKQNEILEKIYQSLTDDKPAEPRRKKQ